MYLWKTADIAFVSSLLSPYLSIVVGFFLVRGYVAFCKEKLFCFVSVNDS